MSLNTCQMVTRESLDLLSGNLKLSASLPSFLKPTMRSCVVEAIGAWRAEAILGPVKLTILTIRKPPRYTAGSEWMA